MTTQESELYEALSNLVREVQEAGLYNQFRLFLDNAESALAKAEGHSIKIDNLGSMRRTP